MEKGFIHNNVYHQDEPIFQENHIEVVLPDGKKDYISPQITQSAKDVIEHTNVGNGYKHFDAPKRQTLNEKTILKDKENQFLNRILRKQPALRALIFALLSAGAALAFPNTMFWQVEWAMKALSGCLAIESLGSLLEGRLEGFPILDRFLQSMCGGITASMAMIFPVFIFVGVCLAFPIQLGMCVLSFFQAEHMWVGFELGGLYIALGAFLALAALLSPDGWGDIRDEGYDSGDLVCVGLSFGLLPVWFVGLGLAVCELVPGV